MKIGTIVVKSIDDACKVGPSGRRDVPCTVRLNDGRNVYQFKSRAAAIKFFSQGAKECDGSEAERYQQVSDFLMVGCTDVSDGYEFTEDMERAVMRLAQV